MKLEDVKAPLTLGGASYILFLYINSTKEVVSLLEVELHKRMSISLAGAPIEAIGVPSIFKVTLRAAALEMILQTFAVSCERHHHQQLP